MALLKVRDECTKLIGHRFLNSHICLAISLVQLAVCFWAVAQHINSYLTYQQILKCDFLNGSLPLEAVDAVIFDIRLFHYLWGIRGCVAEYLDGGFGRLAWCVSHTTALLFSIPTTFLAHPKPCYFWPLLFQQSAYGICLLVLLLAALPRIIMVMAAPQAAPLAPILFYFIGTGLNFFHLYVYWHWYWHVSAMWNSAVRIKFGGRLENANNRSRRDRPMKPVEEMEQLGTVSEHVEFQTPKIILPTDTSLPLLNGHIPTRIQSSTVPPSSGTVDIWSGDEGDIDEEEEIEYVAGPTPPPPAPIYATRLDWRSRENRGRDAQPHRRRLLPPTPDLPKHGELPRSVLYLPHAQV